MRKTKNAAHICLVLCLFFALFTILFCGIPFLNVPPITETEQLNTSREFSQSYHIALKTEQGDALSRGTYEILSARLLALPYTDTELIDNKDGTFSLVLPKRLGSKAEELAVLLCSKGEITYTDTEGNELISSDAVSRAEAGFGRLSESSASGHYYLEFYLREEYRPTFESVTRTLAEQAEADENVLCVKLDGADILQATVGEPMTQQTFLIGGNFEDASLPSLYAAFVSSGPLDQTVLPSDAEVLNPTISAKGPLFSVLALVCLGLLLWGILSLKFGLFSVPAMVHLSVYLLTAAVFYQISGLHLSSYSLLGHALALLLQTAVLARCFFGIRTYLSLGKSFPAALSGGLRATRVFYLVFHAVYLILASLCLALFSGVSTQMGDLAQSLFFSAVYSPIACIWSVWFFGKLFAALNQTSPEFFRIRPDNQSN